MRTALQWEPTQYANREASAFLAYLLHRHSPLVIMYPERPPPFVGIIDFLAATSAGKVSNFGLACPQLIIPTNRHYLHDVTTERYTLNVIML